MGRGKDDEGNARRKERKVRKDVQSARRRQRKETGLSMSEVFEEVCSGPGGVLMIVALLAWWWSFWLSPYLWPPTAADLRRSGVRTPETRLFQRMTQNCLDPHNDLVKSEVHTPENASLLVQKRLS